MLPRSVHPYITFLGTIVQLGGSLLLLGLFLLLRRYTRRRRYFLEWGKAWMAISLAMCAIVIRYNILPSVAAVSGDDAIQVRSLYATYLVARLAFLAYLIQGTLIYVRGTRPRVFPAVAAVAAIVYTATALAFAPGLERIIAFLAPVTMFAAGWCAGELIALPHPRRSLGSRVVAGSFIALGILWALYLVAFGLASPGDVARTGFRSFIVVYATYFDLLAHLALGFGMVVLLMEHAKREVDNAHAELAVAHDQLRRSSLYDTVTGSMNRRAFVEGLGLDVARATFGAVMMLDLDNLKRVNDQYGHAAGDALLCHLVDVLRGELRASDKLYRWGGDEFLIVFPGADRARTQHRIETVLAEAPACLVPETETTVRLLVSVGTARYTSADDLRKAIDRADAEMYRAKSRRKIGDVMPVANR
jgi:diguanylate cyclase (GGDEF)-like protein